MNLQGLFISPIPLINSVKNKLGNLVIWTVILIPVVVYLGYGYHYSGPIFWGDDYDLLETITLSPEAESLGEKWHLWTKQQNEHRVVFPRLITYLNYLLEGFINWKTLILTANLIWVFILYFFWRAFQEQKLPSWMFIPIPWLLFQPQYYENIIWATSILQQSNVVFWLSFTVFLYAKGYYKAALVPAVVATFSHGSGLCSFLVVLFLIFLEKRWKLLPYWIIATLIFYVLYFFKLEKGQSANFSESLSNLTQLVLSFFAFSGSLTRVVLNNPLWAALLGVLMFAIITYTLIPPIWKALSVNKPKIRPLTLILIGNVAFFVISAALVSVSRSWAGLEAIMPPRYQHYTVFLASWTYLMILDYTSKSILLKRLALGFIFLAMLFNGISYVVYTPTVSYRKNYLIADETNYLNHGKFLQYHWTFNRNIEHTYQKALEKGIVRMTKQLEGIVSDDAPTSDWVDLRFRVSTNTSPNELNPTDEFLWVEADLKDKKNVFLYFSPVEGQGYWLPLRGSRAAFKDLIFKAKTRGSNYTAQLDYANLPSGYYRVGIFMDDEFTWTNNTIHVKPDRLIENFSTKTVL